MCRRLLFRCNPGTNIYGHVEIQCKCKYLNVLEGELKDSSKNIPIDNHFNIINN